jgi:hypothetical protein
MRESLHLPDPGRYLMIAMRAKDVELAVCIDPEAVMSDEELLGIVKDLREQVELHARFA